MISLPYIEPVFRPPSEWKSLILQVTNGCSHNLCTFCDMYTSDQKKFRPKPQAEIENELAMVANTGAHIPRIFLADGDAMVLSYKRLEQLLISIKTRLPSVSRVSAYCLPRNLKNKSVDELRYLKDLGLSLVYVGCESGDDHVLSAINKGETFKSSLEALQKLKQAGIKSSVMILNGMGGVEFSKQHAINSAKLMNESQPEYLSTLVVSYPMGEERVRQGYQGKYQLPDTKELIQEMHWLMGGLELENTIFRSDHASNYLVLKGTLNKDKERLMDQIETALFQPDKINLRPEWSRGL